MKPLVHRLLSVVGLGDLVSLFGSRLNDSAWYSRRYRLVGLSRRQSMVGVAIQNLSRSHKCSSHVTPLCHSIHQEPERGWYGLPQLLMYRFNLARKSTIHC